jgi:hypothetical protein
MVGVLFVAVFMWLPAFILFLIDDEIQGRRFQKAMEKAAGNPEDYPLEYDAKNKKYIVKTLEYDKLTGKCRYKPTDKVC